MALLGLEGQGTVWDLVLAAAVWVGVPLVVLLLGKLADSYFEDVWP